MQKFIFFAKQIVIFSFLLINIPIFAVEISNEVDQMGAGLSL